MIVSIHLSEEEEQLFKNYAEFTGVDLSTLFKRALLEKIELEHELNIIAEYEKEKTKLEIESTPAADLVDMAPNADALQRERNSITECFRQELRNRLEQKLHRAGSSRAD